jgi:signal transduction histidine kinase
LNSSVIHDLNNLLASIQTNAFLLRGAQSPEGTEALEGIEAAVDEATRLSRRLEALGVRPLRETPPLRVEDAIELVKPLLERLGRDDLELTVHIGPETKDVLLGGSLFEHGFLSLAALAAEVSPTSGGLVVTTRRGAQPRCIEVSLTLAGVQMPNFLALDGPGAAMELGIRQLVRWLAQHNGGDLTLEALATGGLRFDLRLPEAEAETLPPPPSGAV